MFFVSFRETCFTKSPFGTKDLTLEILDLAFAATSPLGINVETFSKEFSAATYFPRLKKISP